MARRKSVEQMSAEELYEMARKREEQERAAADESKEQVAALKEQRKELIAEHKKALKALDREIAALGGKRRGRRAGGGAQRGQLTERALALVAKHGPVTGRELKAKLDGEGLNTAYLSQTLAGLRTKGKIKSPSRGVYQSA
ncbi:MAG TPA: hypothetical protein VIX81_06775 [Gammaproteobacteria bacterium]